MNPHCESPRSPQCVASRRCAWGYALPLLMNAVSWAAQHGLSMAPLPYVSPLLRPKSPEDSIECSVRERDDFDGQSVTPDELEQLEDADEGQAERGQRHGQFRRQLHHIERPAERTRMPYSAPTPVG